MKGSNTTCFCTPDRPSDNYTQALESIPIIRWYQPYRLMFAGNLDLYAVYLVDDVKQLWQKKNCLCKKKGEKNMLVLLQKGNIISLSIERIVVWCKLW